MRRGPVPTGRNPRPSSMLNNEAALRAALSRVAAVVRVELRDDRTAVVTFALHDEAMRAVAAGPDALYKWLDTKYNARPYAVRGW